MPFVFAEDIRALEAQAVRNGTSYVNLMENAGSAAAEYLIENGIVSDESFVLILCGAGNNGGDGYVIARCFSEHMPKMKIKVIAVNGEPTTSTARVMYDRLIENTGVPIVSLEEMETIFADSSSESVVVIDAIYGIGYRGELPHHIVGLFDRLRSRDLYTVAIDLPSGMQADHNSFDPCLLRADLTVTFSSAKRCMLFEESRACCGKVVVRSVGISPYHLKNYEMNPIMLTREIALDGIVPRKQDSHKGTFGRVYALCGSYGMAGAAMLCGKAALRCGVGLMHYFIPKSIYSIVASQLWEAVYRPLDDTNDGGLLPEALKTINESIVTAPNTAFLVGPGLSRNEQTMVLVRRLLPSLTMPIVIDADGLNALIGHIHELKAMSENGAQIVLTPHPAEAARLLGCTVEEIERDRLFSSKRLASLSGCTVVLKGHQTIVTQAVGTMYINTTGCSGLAKGGSGDILTGMIAALLAQGVVPLQAAATAVYLHGLASVKTSDRLSETGMLPTDLLDDLPILLSHFEKRV